MNKIYHLLAVVIAVIVIVLAIASFSKSAVEIYTSWYMITLWAVASVLALYLITKKLNRKNLVYCLFHFSLIVILAGALLTHFFGHNEELHMRKGEISGDLILQDFKIEYYPSTKTPQNYVSTLLIAEKTETKTEFISINKPFKSLKRRIFLTSFDNDNQGVTFTITNDPYGTATTYFGYLLFFHLTPLVLFQRMRKHK